MTQDLVSHLARFAGALREAGVRIATGDEVDALQALVRVDLADPAEVRQALRCSLKVRPRDLAAFDALFRQLWLNAAASAQPDCAGPACEHGPKNPRPRGDRPKLGAGAAEQEVEVEVPEGGEPGWSREARLRQKHFDDCDDRDLAEMERLIVRLAAQLATRRSRRHEPVPSRGVVDLRRSLRRALATGGELLLLARRAHPIETPRLVLICDTSGSMDTHTRFLLAFARALKRVARRTEVFAFNTELTRITSLLSGGQQRSALTRLAEQVPDWSGGTRIGESLATFATRYLGALVDARTVVLVFSDGLDRGDPALLADALQRIRAKARKVIWLNPLLSDPRYQPTARGMAAALPFVDRLVPAHNLETLERLLPYLTN